MEYAIGIDLGGTSIKYALVDKAGFSSFEGRLPSFASVSSAEVIRQLVKAATIVKDEAGKRDWAIKGIGSVRRVLWTKQTALYWVVPRI